MEESGAQRNEEPFVFHVVDGRYTGDLYGGLWRAELVGFAQLPTLGTDETTESVHPLALFPPPAPQVRLLSSGSTAEIDFAYERARGIIEGQTVDEDGKPHGGLKVSVRRSVPVKSPVSERTFQLSDLLFYAFSADDGSFSFGNLPTGPYRLSVEPQGFRTPAAPGVNAIGAAPVSVDVRLGPQGISPVVITVARPHPVRVRGRIVVDAGWLAREHAEKRAPAVFLATGPATPPDGHSGMSRRWQLDTTDGEFDCFVEAAANHPRLEIELGQAKAVYPLTLSPDEEPAPLLIRFPR